MVLGESFFNELRTKQQTGYITASRDLERENQLLHLLAVQSSTHHPTELLARFELFLEEMIRDFPEKISEERFNQLKQNYIERLQRPPQNLTESINEHYTLAFKDGGNFRKKQQLIAAAKQLSYEEFHGHFLAFFSRENSKRIAALVEGKPTASKCFKYHHVSQELLKQSGHYISASTEKP